jgi:hypothetical protein
MSAHPEITNISITLALDASLSPTLQHMTVGCINANGPVSQSVLCRIVREHLIVQLDANDSLLKFDCSNVMKVCLPIICRQSEFYQSHFLNRSHQHQVR